VGLPETFPAEQTEPKDVLQVSDRQQCLSLDFGSPQPVLLKRARDDPQPSADVEEPGMCSGLPNPHLDEIVKLDSKPKSVLRPITGEIRAGKNSYVYDAHTYHTKVPPQGIEKLIEYYTNPGDVVLDPFSGSGMTGVAATNLNRRAILVDLSPAACFIASNLIAPTEPRPYLDAVHAILRMSEELERRLYSTTCRECHDRAVQLYTVWSFGALCSRCGREFTIWDVARDVKPKIRECKIKSEFNCPHCGRLVEKKTLVRTRRYPVQIGYHCCGSRQQERMSAPDAQDVELLADIDREGIPKDLWYPTDRFPRGVNTGQAIRAGITSIDKVYTKRALWAMAYLWDKAIRWPDPFIRSKLVFTLTSLYQRVTLLSEFRFWGGSGNIANYNVPAISNEQNVFRTFERKARTISWYLESAPRVPREFRLSTQSACHIPQLPDDSVDYIFTDPPFGGNINYSEMNFLWESWLRSFTDNREEIVVNRAQGKDVSAYQGLLTQAFREMKRVLKPGAWLSVVFHNSSARVWQALQEALHDAGFTIDGTQTFDKRHGTFKQFVSDNAVGYDLVLHCRKSRPNATHDARHDEATMDGVMAFIIDRLGREPERYLVSYLHVKREDELDYRRLYSEWLSHSIRNSDIRIDFPRFRSLVDGVRLKRGPPASKLQATGILH
jgi:DNA modification methylase/DNA-directed RNA polymerase subunit RPC12/RpoP